MKICIQILLLGWFGYQISTSQAQIPPLTEENPSSLDGSIRYGKLDNGLAYYIKSLPNSQEKINLRFFVLAGSNHEGRDHLQMAHFLEHMAFKSTKHFPFGLSNKLANDGRLQMSAGDIYGEVNRFSTDYWFDAPKHNDKAIQTGLLWFKDIASGLSLRESEIDTERGVLAQEIITGSQDNIEKTKLESSLSNRLRPCYEDYSNILEHLETFDSKRLREFYHKWYTPDRMALIAVGNIEDVDSLENVIREKFDDIEPASIKQKEPDCREKYLNQPPQFAIIESNETPPSNTATASIYFKLSPGENHSLNLEKKKRRIKLNILSTILEERIKEATSVYSPFVTGNISQDVYSTIVLRLDIKNKKEERAFKTIFEVIKQFNQFGAVEKEFFDALRVQKSIVNGTDFTRNSYWLEGIKDHFVHEEAFRTSDQKSLEKWLDEFSVQEFNKFIQDLNLLEPADIGFIAPSGHSVLSITEKQLRSWIKDVAEEPVSPYSPAEVPSALLHPLEVNQLQVKHYEDKGVGETGARELVLNNGAKVILKSVNPGFGPYQNHLMFHAFYKKGGLSFPKEDYFSAINAPGFIKNSGVRNLDKFELQRYLKTTSLSWNGFSLYVNDLESGLRLQSKPEDIESSLQLMYLLLSEPKMDSLAYEDWLWSVKMAFHNQRFDPVSLDLNNIRSNIIGDYSGSTRGTEWYKGLEKVDMHRGVQILKELFGDTKNLTFLVTGNFEVDSVIPLVNKYIGNLTNLKGNQVYYQGVVKTPPYGPLLIEVPSNNNFEKQNYLYFPSFVKSDGAPVDWREIIKMELLGRIWNQRVKALRFEKGYSLYSPIAGAKHNRYSGQSEIFAVFSCTPKDYPMLRKEIKMIAENLKSEPLSEDVLNYGRNLILGKYSSNGSSTSHRSLHRNLFVYYRFGIPQVDTEEIQHYIRSITSEDLMKVANDYLKEEYFYEFVSKG